MKVLIVLALVAAAHAQSFFLQDTPAVASAKAAHFAEYAKAAALAGASLPDVYRSVIYIPAPAAAPAPVVTPQGFLTDTPEVAAARAAHLAEHARATAAATAAAPAAPVFRTSDPYAEYYRAFYNFYYPSLTRSIYSGHQAVPTVLPSGYLADTPEVAHAKITHLYKLYKESARL